LWAGSETEGAMKIEPDGRITRFGSGDTQLLDVAGRIVFLPADGVFSRFENGRLVADELLGHIHAPEPFSYSGVDRDGNVWIGSRPPRVLRRLGNGRYAREAHAIGTLEGDMDSFYADAGGVMWLGSERGLYRVAPSTFDAPSEMGAPMIHRVVARNDRVVVDGNAGSPGAITLPHNFGRLRVEVAPMSYRAATSYQYRLDPVDSEWTSWSPQAFLDYTNLAADDYTFRVRTRGAAGRVSEETMWSFTILPPWYATWWAIAIWIALAAATVAAIVLLRTRTLQRRARRLQFLIDGQTETLRETVEQLRVAKEGLEKLSLADPLTGVANRRYFDRAIAESSSSARLSLILMDLDHFKDLNDARGHLAGDECLRRVAEFLESVIRDGDVCRWGGEEFAILLRNADEATALAVAECIRIGVASLGVTASLGVAARTDDSDPRLLVEAADRALYSAKRAGRNRVWSGAAAATGA
jgi:diguanylate cyclase (GGDEF)-like protein